MAIVAHAEPEAQQPVRVMLPEYCGGCTGWHRKMGRTGYCITTGRRTSSDSRCDVPAIPIAEQWAGA
jgi:hypothetical protein